VVATLSQLSFIVVMFARRCWSAAQPAGVFQGLAYALQPTYAADGLRHALAGTLDARLALDIGALAACALVSLIAVERGMRWGAT
jgi:hypothetical protein